MGRKRLPPRGLYQDNGWWYMDFTPPVGERVRKALRTRDQAEAEAIFAKRRAQLIAEAYGLERKKDQRVATVLSRYLDVARLTKGESRLKMDSKRIRDFLAFTKATMLTSVTPEHFTSFAVHRLKEARELGLPLSKASVLEHLKAVRTFFRWATRNRYIERDPADGVEWAALKPELVKKRITYLTPDERDALLAAAAEPVRLNGRGKKGRGNTRARITPIHAIVAVAVFAGLRLSEILWLDWSDVDFRAKTVSVRAKGEWKPKTLRERTVPLFPQLEAVLLLFKRDAGMCFSTREGKDGKKRLGRRNVLTELTRAAERAGLEAKGVDFLVLRHTFATHLVSRGVPLATVSEWLGHESIVTTETFYAEFMPHGEVYRLAAAALA